MIGGHAIAEHREHPRAMNIRKRNGRPRHVLEVRRQLDVRGVCIPLVQIPFGNGHGLPARVALEHFAVYLAVLLGGNRGADGGLYFLRGRPNLTQIDGLAGGVGS